MSLGRIHPFPFQSVGMQFGLTSQQGNQASHDAWASGAQMVYMPPPARTQYYNYNPHAHHPVYPPHIAGHAHHAFIPSQHGYPPPSHPPPSNPQWNHPAQNRPPPGSQPPAEPVLWGEPHSNVFAASLPPNMGDKELMDLFSPFGDIISAKVSRDLSTGNSKHYGFVQFRAAQSAAAAIANLNGRNLTPTNRLHVSIAKHDEARHSGECDRLYVRNLPLWVTRDHLKSVFSEHGTVIEANVLGNKSRGAGSAVQLTVGFVRMSSVEEAKHCIRTLHGSRAFDESSPVLIRFMENQTMKATRHTRKQHDQEGEGGGEHDANLLKSVMPIGTQSSPHLGTPHFNSGPSSTTLSHSSTPATPVLYQVSPASIQHISSVPFVVNSGGLSPSMTAYWNNQLIQSTAATAAYSNESIRNQVSPVLVGTSSSPSVAAVLPTPNMLCQQPSEVMQNSPTLAVSTSSTPARSHQEVPFPQTGDLVFEGVRDEATLSYVIQRQTGCFLAKCLTYDGKYYVRLTDPTSHFQVQLELNGKSMSNDATLTVTTL